MRVSVRMMTAAVVLAAGLGTFGTIGGANAAVAAPPQIIPHQGAIGGVVSNNSGPMSASVFLLNDRGGIVAHRQTDANGRYAMGAAPGTYTLLVRTLCGEQSFTVTLRAFRAIEFNVHFDC